MSEAAPRPAPLHLAAGPLHAVRDVAPAGAPTVLLLHGLGASHHIWRGLRPLLAGRVELWSVDLPGAGATPPIEGATPTHLAQFLAGLLELEGGPRRFDVVVGHSLGVSVALELALRQPARVGGVMAINGVERMTLARRLLLRAWWVRQLLELPEGKPSLHGPLGTELYLRAITGRREAVTDELVESYARLAREPGYFRELSRALDGLARHTRPPGDLRQLQRPVSVVWGTRDPLFAVEEAERLVRLFPEAALHRLPTCGHCPPEEAPQLVAPLLLELVGRAMRTAARAA